MQDDLIRLTQLARTQGWIEADDALVELTSAGEGNMNWVRRARTQSGASMILKRSLPYVAKYPDIPAPEARIEVEAAFYQTLSRAGLTAATPAVLGFDATTRTLCLEDLGEGRDLTSLYANRSSETPQQMAKLLAWLSDLHALPIP